MRLLSPLVVASSLLTASFLGCDPADPDDIAVPAEEEPQPSEAASTEVDYRWMPDEDSEKFLAIEEQFAGFSQSMQEVGYRYNELYWAGQHQNWDYAQYHLEKIDASIERGIQRRSDRAASARPFLDDTIPAMEEALEAEDPDTFDEQFDDLTNGCVTCHGQEDVSFITVAPLDHQLSPVQHPHQDQD